MIIAVMQKRGAMNKDINKTLMALVPILRMNGENVTNIEAVHDWYKAGDREYMKEVAEITYDNGTVRYADIGCDSNLTAIYDVIAVIQQITPRSKAIERIERGVYSLPSAQPEIIHCRECKHWKQQTNYAGAPLSFGFCESDDMWQSLYGETYEVSHIDTDDDFYCGYAERRTDDKTNKSSSC